MNPKSTPKISVIIPVYNVETYLPHCLSSVKSQTYENLEIILIDDGSTDNSTEICKTFAKSEPRVKLHRQNNRGLSEARNAGLKLATGEYLTFVDSDDYINSTYIEKLLQAVQKNQTKLAICAIRELREDREIDFGKNHKSTLMSQETCLKRLLQDDGFNVSAYAKLYHKDLWQNLNFPSGKIHEDLGTTYKTILKCEKIAYLSTALYNYHNRKDSLAHQNFTDQKLDIIELTDKMCDDIEAAHTNLKNYTDLRRLQARFSVLRQMLTEPKLNKAQIEQKSALTAYLRLNKSKIFDNPAATTRDKLAMTTLLLGEPIFKTSWNLYDKLRRN